MSFLAGAGEMAGRIRAHDWSSHAFGPAEDWPQCLRAALGICLQSTFPTAIYWGPDLRLLYNDSWARFLGPRHPAALGAPGREVWPDIWHVVGPQFEGVLRSGAGYFAENQFLPMQRFGAPEETYWSYSFTLIRSEGGVPAGVFNAGIETTAGVLGQRQTRFLLDLNEALRANDRPEAARFLAMALLGAHLRGARAGLAELDPEGELLTIVEEWQAPDVAPLPQELALSTFGPHVVGELRAGRVLRIDDAAADRRLGGEDVRRAFAAAGVAAAVAAPWRNDGRIAGALYVHSAEPRAWNDVDAMTVEEVLHRARDWIERHRATERERMMMREIDHRARNALAVAQSRVRLTRAEGIGEFREKIEARIGALARAHTLLAAERWAPIDLAGLLREELAPYLGSEAAEVRAEGPAAKLPPELAQTFALLLHELVVNAAKHGALRSSGGLLDVSWRIEPGEQLRLEWAEELPQGERPAAATRAGFGSALLRRVVEAELGGGIDWRVRPEGLICRIDFPLRGLRARPVEEALRPAAEVPLRILVAEDEPLVAMDLQATLEDFGHRLFAVCATVEEAETALATGLPDLAVLNANLRGTSSTPLAEALRRRGVAVVFATGYGEIPGLPPGLADVPKLGKPFGAAALSEAIGRALEAREGRGSC